MALLILKISLNFFKRRGLSFFFWLVFLLSCFYPVSRFAAEKDFRQLRSEHFVINYDESVDYNYVYKVKDISEKFYREITQEFRLIRDKLWLWDNRAEISIAKDKKDYGDKFNCPSWSTACVDYRGKIIYTYPDQERFTPIFIHELTHIIFREYVGGGNELPLWLDEAVAVYMEDKFSKQSYRNNISILSAAIKEDRDIRLSELNKIAFSDIKNKPQDYINLFYLESFSIVYFIINRYGNDKFHLFLYFLKKGNTTLESLSKAIYSLKTWEDLEKQWKKFYQE